MRRTSLIILIVFLISSSALAIEGTYPYANIVIKAPGLDDPYPGLGDYFSSLGEGIDTVFWNPASLGKIRSSQGSLGFTASNLSDPFNKNYKIKDQTFNIAGSENQVGLNNSILFTADQTTVTTQEREFTGQMLYSTLGSGVNYRQAVKVGDNFALGISSRGDTELDANLSGSFPLTYLMDFDLAKSINNFMGTGISINNLGQMTYTYSGYTYTSEASVWNGFLKQVQRIPFSAVTEARNNINVKSDLTFSGAANWNKLYVGANITPISATTNIDNYASAIINAGTTDPYFYVPNFDPNNESEVLNWMRDQEQYGTENGYKKRSIRVPAGESIGEARYRGFFSASTTRFDLGAIFDVNEFFSLGWAYENLGGAALNFQGNGRTAYVVHRISTADAGSILDPTTSTSWSPFKDTYEPMSDTENVGMLSSINVPLPQKIRWGATLKRPWLISVDYEQNLTPFELYMKDENGNFKMMRMTGVNIIRLGMETQFLIFPLWLRGGTAVMLEPNFENVSSKDQDNIKKIFKFGLIPIKMESGAYVNLWGLYTGGNGGFNLSPFFSAWQLDTMNMDVSKTLFYNIFMEKDFWRVSYEQALDPGATAAAYAVRPNKDIKDVNDALSIPRWLRTLTVSYKF